MNTPKRLLLQCDCDRWFDVTNHAKWYVCCPSCGAETALEYDPAKSPRTATRTAEVGNVAVISDCATPRRSAEEERLDNAHIRIGECQRQVNNLQRAVDHWTDDLRGAKAKAVSLHSERDRVESRITQELGELRASLNELRRERFSVPARDVIAAIVHEHTKGMRNHDEVLEKRILLLEETSRELARRIAPQ